MERLIEILQSNPFSIQDLLIYLRKQQNIFEHSSEEEKKSIFLQILELANSFFPQFNPIQSSRIKSILFFFLSYITPEKLDLPFLHFEMNSYPPLFSTLVNIYFNQINIKKDPENAFFFLSLLNKHFKEISKGSDPSSYSPIQFYSISESFYLKTIPVIIAFNLSSNDYIESFDNFCGAIQDIPIDSMNECDFYLFSSILEVMIFGKQFTPKFWGALNHILKGNHNQYISGQILTIFFRIWYDTLKRIPDKSEIDIQIQIEMITYLLKQSATLPISYSCPSFDWEYCFEIYP